MERDLGAQKAGQVSFNWDGLKTNSLPSKSGNFVFRVDAKDGRGKMVETNPRAQARVIGISFDGNEPVFLVGDANHQDKVTMRNIVQIELDNGSPLGKAPPRAPAATSKLSNFFEFKKGRAPHSCSGTGASRYGASCGSGWSAATGNGATPASGASENGGTS